MNRPSPSSPIPGHGPAARLRHELRVYAVIAAYLYVCFAALLLYKTALLQDAGLHYLPLGAAALKALVIGKFVLIGDAIRKAAQRQSMRLLARIVTRVLWLLVILILLTMAEEWALGAWHGQSSAELVAAFHARSPLETLAEVLLMLLVLTPLVAVTEVNQALGPGTLAGLLNRASGTAGHAAAHGGQADQEHR